MTDLATTPLQPLIANAQLRHCPKGQILLYEGEEPTYAYIIKSGVVKMYDIDTDGNEKIIHLFKSPAIFPAVFLFSSTGQTNTFYTTIADTEYYAVPRALFESHLTKDPQFTLFCLRWFANEMQEVIQRMSSLEKASTRSKLLTTLTYLARQHASPSQDGWQRVTFPVSHQLLADLIGVTRESTTMAMKSLQKESIIRSPKLGVLELNQVILNSL